MTSFTETALLGVFILITVSTCSAIEQQPMYNHDHNFVRPKVYPLSTSNFFERIQNGTRWLVLFHAPWCPHCRKLRPAFEEMARRVVSGTNVFLGHVDCTVYKALCKNRFHIQGYPTIMFFRGYSEFEEIAERTREGLMGLLDRVQGDDILTLSHPVHYSSFQEQADSLKRNGRTTFILQTPVLAHNIYQENNEEQAPPTSARAPLSKMERDFIKQFEYGAFLWKHVASFYRIERGEEEGAGVDLCEGSMSGICAIAIRDSHKLLRYTYHTDEFARGTGFELEEWVRRNRLRAVEEITALTWAKVISEDLTVVLFIDDLDELDEDALARTEYVAKQVEEVAALPEFQHLSFALANYTRLPTFSSSHNVNTETVLPKVIVMNYKDVVHYEMDKLGIDGEKMYRVPTADMIAEFLRKVEKGEIKAIWSIFSTGDFFRFYVAKLRDFILNRPILSFLIIVGISLLLVACVIRMGDSDEDRAAFAKANQEVIEEMERNESLRWKLEKEVKNSEIIVAEGLERILEKEAEGAKLEKKRKKKKTKRSEELRKSDDGKEVDDASLVQSKIMENLSQLVKYKEAGILDEDEFRLAKKALLKKLV